MTIVNLRLMSINDYIESQCRACLFLECMDCEPCLSCIRFMQVAYCNQFKIRSNSRQHHEICDC